MKQRPVFMGLIGAVYAFSSVVGPLMGGAFADRVSWRWCFYINLPIGAMALVIVFFSLPSLPVVNKSSESTLATWLHVDWMGAVLSFGMVTTLLLGVQWGGIEKPWGSPTIIALLVLFVVLLLSFIGWECWVGEQAILPIREFLLRDIIGSSISMFFVEICFMLMNYYLPLLYQVRGHSAARSGIDILPFMVFGVLFSFVAGGCTSVTGYAWPFLAFSPLIAATAFGLFFTVDQYTNATRMIGFQILAGMGLGACIQLPIVVAQGVFVTKNRHLTPQATSLITFLQLLGAAVGLAITGAVFQGQLRTELKSHAPDLPVSIMDAVLESVEVIAAIPEPVRDQVVTGYVAALERVFLIGIPSTIVASLAALLLHREKVKLEA